MLITPSTNGNHSLSLSVTMVTVPMSTVLGSLHVQVNEWMQTCRVKPFLHFLESMLGNTGKPDPNHQHPQTASVTSNSIVLPAALHQDCSPVPSAQRRRLCDPEGDPSGADVPGRAAGRSEWMPGPKTPQPSKHHRVLWELSGGQGPHDRYGVCTRWVTVTFSSVSLLLVIVTGSLFFSAVGLSNILNCVYLPRAKE